MVDGPRRHRGPRTSRPVLKSPGARRPSGSQSRVLSTSSRSAGSQKHSSVIAVSLTACIACVAAASEQRVTARSATASDARACSLCRSAMGREAVTLPPRRRRRVRPLGAGTASRSLAGRRPHGGVDAGSGAASPRTAGSGGMTSRIVRPRRPMSSRVIVRSAERTRRGRQPVAATRERTKIPGGRSADRSHVRVEGPRRPKGKRQMNLTTSRCGKPVVRSTYSSPRISNPSRS